MGTSGLLRDSQVAIASKLTMTPCMGSITPAGKFVPLNDAGTGTGAIAHGDPVLSVAVIGGQ